MKLAIATCERPPVPDSDAERLIPILAERGVEAELISWSDPGADWSAFDLIWISSTWDYHERLDEFLAWLRRAAAATMVQNPPELIEWNVDKRYLRGLAEPGVPVIPTVWVEDEGGPAVREATRRGWTDLVVKPAVDLGAARLERTSAVGLRAAVERVERPALVQPFLDSLGEEGELSLVYLGGELSHAVRKTPADGDFRVQAQHGGRYQPADAPSEAIAIGDRVIEAIGDRVAAARGGGGRAPLYGRVDLVRGPDGGPCVIELELIEPALFLDVVGESATARFADLLVGTMGAA